MVLLSDRERLTRSYFVNLVGSGVGCFVVYPFLSDLGAEAIVLIILFTSAAGGALSCWRHARRWTLPATAFTGLLALSIPFAEAVLPFQPDPSDFYRGTVDKLSEAQQQSVEPKRVLLALGPRRPDRDLRLPRRGGLVLGRHPRPLLCPGRRGALFSDRRGRSRRSAIHARLGQRLRHRHQSARGR